MPVAKKLKRVTVGAAPVRAKKLSASRRRHEAREKASGGAEETVAVVHTDSLALREALLRVRDTTDLDEICALMSHEDARVRVRALEQVCPCRMRDAVDEIWDRVVAMVDDRDLGVRKQVLHTLCDGSPVSRELQVLEAVEKLNRETDRDLRRMAHKVLASYRRTGIWDIL